MLRVRQDHLEVTLDYRERRAQLVRYVAHEIAPHLLQVRLLGHIAHENEAVTVAKQRDGKLQRLLALSLHAQLQRVIKGTRNIVAVKGGQAHQVQQRLAAVCRVAQPQQALRGLIAPLDRAGGCDHDGAIMH